MKTNEQGVVVEYPNATMELPEWMIHQSFRYILGRMTYAVSTWVDWAVENWDQIPDHEKGIIIRELDEEFIKDDAVRKREKTGIFYRPLGMDTDREQWERVRKLYYACS